jgi:hypothetical protein
VWIVVIRVDGTTVFQTAAASSDPLRGAGDSRRWPEGVAWIGILSRFPSRCRCRHRDAAVFAEETHVPWPLRDCIVRAEARPDLQIARGIYASTSTHLTMRCLNHQYALSRSTPKRPRTAPPPKLAKYVFDPAEQRPVLISEVCGIRSSADDDGRTRVHAELRPSNRRPAVAAGAVFACVTEIAPTQRSPWRFDPGERRQGAG